jgi:hypothetical protein
MANDEMPRIVKIGATLRSPEERLNDARATTWAPTCYRIIAQAPVEDAFAAEQALHTLLAHRRLEARREFFRIPHAEARALFAAIRAIGQLTDDDSVLGPDETDEPDAGICPGETGDGTGTDEGGASAINPLLRSLRSLRAARESRFAVAGATSQRDSEPVQDRLRAWVESKYTHLPLREKDAGTKLDKLHGEYARSGVHARPLGKIKFAQMLSAVYPGIGPHKNSTGSAHVYLLRVR